MYSLKN